MKKSFGIVITNIFFLSLSAPAIAQEASWYKAENCTYYEVRQCIPHSDVLFYSQVGGGRLIKKGVADELGTFTFASNKDIPANVLNTKFRNADGVKGSGMVSFFGEKEFTLNNICIKKHNDIKELSWDAEINPDVAICFDVMASADGVNFTKIGRVEGASGLGERRYISHDELEQNYFYKIDVVNSITGLRYSSSILNIETQGIKVYPTATTGELNIQLDNSGADNTYRIINGRGQIVQTGKFVKRTSKLDISNLPSGNYLVVVNSKNRQLSSRIVKLGN